MSEAMRRQASFTIEAPGSTMPATNTAPAWCIQEFQVRLEPSFDGEDAQHILPQTTPPSTPPKSHARKKPAGHIPRPRNAFILFRSDFVQKSELASLEKNHQNLSRIAGVVWKSMPEDEKRVWYARAEEDRQRHAQMHPEYQYTPTDPVMLGRRRCVKKGRGEDEVREQSKRCERLASLVVEGRSGEVLEEAIKRLEETPSMPVVPTSGRSHVPNFRSSKLAAEFVELDQGTNTPRFGFSTEVMRMPRSNPLAGNSFNIGDLQFLARSPKTPPPSGHTSLLTPSPTPMKSLSFGFSAYANSPSTYAATGSQATSSRSPENRRPSPAFENALPSKVRAYGALPSYPPTLIKPTDARWSTRTSTPAIRELRERNDESDDDLSD